MSSDINAFHDVLRTSRHIIAVAGAGLSAASGIPTFRGSGGFWRKYDAISLATPEGFTKNPSLSWQFYHYRREAAKMAHPNVAHHALSTFSSSFIRNSISPGSTFTLITQNVDGLSPRANAEFAARTDGRQQPTESGVSNAHKADDEFPALFEMHGRLFDVLCTSRSCKHVEFNTDSPICESLDGTELLTSAGDFDPEIPTKDLPRCTECGSLARPGVVWFGEVPKHLKTIYKLVDRADLCLVIGTSSTVAPASGYADTVQQNGGKVAVFNIENSEGDEDADFLFLGQCEKTLPVALCLSEQLAGM